MHHSIAGLSANQVRQCLLTMSLVDQPYLLEIFTSLVNLVDKVMMLILSEMNATRSDIVFWDKLARSNYWDILMYRTASSTVKRMVAMQSNQIILDSADEMLRHAVKLKSDFNDMAVFLAKINEAAGYIKNIMLFVNSVRTSRISDENKSAAAETIRNVVFRNANAFVADINVVFADVVPAIYNTVEIDDFLTQNNQNGGSNTNPDDSISEPLRTLIFLQESIRQLQVTVDNIAENSISKSYPFAFTTFRARRPSNMERFWLRNAVLSVGAMYTARVLFLMYQDGTMQRHMEHFQEWVVQKTKEHVIEPVEKLKDELFDTIRRRDGMVAREDLKQSQESLRRMLENFSKSSRGKDLILPNLKEKLADNREKLSKLVDEAAASVKTSAGALTDRFSSSSSNPSASTSGATAGDISNSNSVSSASSSSTTSTTTAAAAAAAAAANAAAVAAVEKSIADTASSLASDLPTPEQAMEALMNEYERELQTPIRGVISGSLTTAILIQIQKLKVHTEAAMLTMDQVLSSNELTMAATAALPAVMLATGIFYAAYAAFRPKVANIGTDTMQLRMLLGEVERSLFVLAEDERAALQSAHAAAANADTLLTMDWLPAGSGVGLPGGDDDIDAGTVNTSLAHDSDANWLMSPRRSSLMLSLKKPIQQHGQHGQQQQQQQQHQLAVAMAKAPNMNMISRGGSNSNLAAAAASVENADKTLRAAAAAAAAAVTVMQPKMTASPPIGRQQKKLTSGGTNLSKSSDSPEKLNPINLDKQLQQDGIGTSTGIAIDTTFDQDNSIDSDSRVFSRKCSKDRDSLGGGPTQNTIAGSGQVLRVQRHSSDESLNNFMFGTSSSSSSSSCGTPSPAEAKQQAQTAAAGAIMLGSLVPGGGLNSTSYAAAVTNNVSIGESHMNGAAFDNNSAPTSTGTNTQVPCTLSSNNNDSSGKNNSAASIVANRGATLRSSRLQVKGMLCFNLARLREEAMDLFGVQLPSNMAIGVGNGPLFGYPLSWEGFLKYVRAVSRSQTWWGWLLRVAGVRKYLVGRNRRSGSVYFSRASSFAQHIADEKIVQGDSLFSAPEFSSSSSSPDESLGFNIGSFEFYSVRMAAHRHRGGWLPDSLLSTVYLMSRAIVTDTSSNEAEAALKQNTSFKKDLQILESPDFEVSVESKIATAARMRSSYRCLAPLS